MRIIELQVIPTRPAGIESPAQEKTVVPRIVPVIDLKDRLVVHGVAGLREKYQAVQSCLTRSAAPRDVAQAFVDDFQFSEVYVADLDAISGSPPAWSLYQQIAEAGLSIWLDAGIRSKREFTAVLEESRSRGLRITPIVGLESIADLDELREILRLCDSSQWIVSVDLEHGKPRTPVSAWCNVAPETIIEQLVALGAARIILLDLRQVGTGQGTGTRHLCHRVSTRFPHVEITSGGGIRDAQDLLPVAESGCQNVLVASALHDGRIRPEDVRRFGER